MTTQEFNLMVLFKIKDRNVFAPSFTSFDFMPVELGAGLNTIRLSPQCQWSDSYKESLPLKVQAFLLDPAMTTVLNHSSVTELFDQQIR